MSAVTYPRFKLTYFPFYGRGGPIRLVLRLANIPFEDNKVSFAEYPALKASGSLPFDSMPVLEIDGTRQLAQSNALMMYTGKLANLVGADALEEGYVLSVMCVIEDMFSAITAAGKSAEARQAAQAGPLTFFMKRLVRLLAENPANSGWFVGNGITVADIKFHAFIILIESGLMDHLTKDFFDNLPEVAAHKAKIEDYVKSKGLSFE